MLSRHLLSLALHFKPEPGWCTPHKEIEGQVTTVSIAFLGLEHLIPGVAALDFRLNVALWEREMDPWLRTLAALSGGLEFRSQQL